MTAPNQLSDVIMRGDRASQPTPTTGTMIGATYFVTDELVQEQWDGSAWQDNTPAGAFDETILASALTDVTTANASTSKHGLLKKLDNDSTHFMDGTGAWAVPAGGGGGATITREPLFVALGHDPTDDFDGASLDGSYTAHSTAGSFVVGNAVTQQKDGSYVRIAFNAQNGCLLIPTTNVDQDVQLGGYTASGDLGGSCLGLALVDSSGNGMGIVLYNDNTCYLLDIASWQVTGGGHGSLGSNHGANRLSDWGLYPAWLRLTRTGGGAYTAYLSLDGTNWNWSAGPYTPSAFTVAKVAIGTFQVTNSGMILADWLDIA